MTEIQYTDTLELYDQIEDFITTRSIEGRGRTPEAAQCRAILNPAIAKIRGELNRRGLPSRKRDFESMPSAWAICKPQWMRDAEQQAEDAADLHDTQKSVLEAM